MNKQLAEANSTTAQSGKQSKAANKTSAGTIPELAIMIFISNIITCNKLAVLVIAFLAVNFSKKAASYAQEAYSSVDAWKNFINKSIEMEENIERSERLLTDLKTQFRKGALVIAEKYRSAQIESAKRIFQASVQLSYNIVKLGTSSGSRDDKLQESGDLIGSSIEYVDRLTEDQTLTDDERRDASRFKGQLLMIKERSEQVALARKALTSLTIDARNNGLLNPVNVPAKSGQFTVESPDRTTVNLQKSEKIGRWHLTFEDGKPQLKLEIPSHKFISSVSYKCAGGNNIGLYMTAKSSDKIMFSVAGDGTIFNTDTKGMVRSSEAGELSKYVNSLEKDPRTQTVSVQFDSYSNNTVRAYPELDFTGFSQARSKLRQACSGVSMSTEGQNSAEPQTFSRALEVQCPRKRLEWLNPGITIDGIDVWIKKFPDVQRQEFEKRSKPALDKCTAGASCVNNAYIKTAVEMRVIASLAQSVCALPYQCTAPFTCASAKP